VCTHSVHSAQLYTRTRCIQVPIHMATTQPNYLHLQST